MRPRDETALVRRPPQPDGPVPVEYAVAVARYLAEASLSPASRRVYRISLAGLAWPLVGRQVPRGVQRRGAVPPLVPLAALDREDTGARLAAALADPAYDAGVRTVNRELSALRSAVGWWQEQGWISRDPTAGIRNLTGEAKPVRPLSRGQVTGLFRLRATLREHAFWRVLYDSGAHADDVLLLDAGRIDLNSGAERTGPGRQAESAIRWGQGTGEVLSWLLAGRRDGPVFLTGRRAPATAAPADVCPVTGRARMSYRRAAEIFTGLTRPLDPAGRGWTLNQLRLAGPERHTGTSGESSAPVTSPRREPRASGPGRVGSRW